MGMKRRFSIGWTLACLLLFSLGMEAQTKQLHTVQRKETAYSIAKAYGVDLNALFDLNPWAESGIRKGDTLRIPWSNAQEQPAGESTDPPEPSGEKPPDIVTEQGTVSDSIPGKKGAGLPGILERVNSAQSDSLGQPRPRPQPPTWSLDTVRVAVFLPFYGGRDSLGRQERRLRQIAQDCAAGIALALSTERPLGAHFKVRYMDTGRDTSGALLCSPQDLVDLGAPVHLAIGPLKRTQFQEVRRWAGMEQAVHLALTDLGEGLTKNAPGVVMPYVPVAQRMEGLARHIAAQHRGEKVLLLATGDIRNIQAEAAFRGAWDAESAKDSLLMLSEVEVKSKGLGSLRDSLTDVRRNVLVVPGGKANRSLAGVLQTEMQLGDSLDFVLYTDKSWRAFEFFDHDLRERVGFTVVDGYGTLADSSVYDGLDSVHFCLARELARLRGGDAGAYGWLAHDLLREAMAWTAGHGPGWAQRMAVGAHLIHPQPNLDGGLHRFFWVPAGGDRDGLINGAVRLMRQEGYQWTEVNRHNASSGLSETVAPR